MGSDRSHRHHYIPKMLLKNFCDDDGRLWMGERTGGRIFSSTPKNVFVIRDLNTSYDFPPAPISGKEEEFLDSIEHEFILKTGLSGEKREAWASPD